MKQICVVPHWDFLRGNKAFTSKSEAVNVAFGLWRQLAAKEGYALNTDDICPPQEADAIWLIDLPRKKKSFDRLMSSTKKPTKVVLQQLESPLITPQPHELRNQSECDFILTYESRRSNDPRRFHYKIPNHLVPAKTNPPFSERRCVVMINSNKMEGWFGSSRVGTRKFPGFGKYINGWAAPAAQRLSPARGELYSWRRKFARAAEEVQGKVLDIYGRGWNGEPVTWLPSARPKPYRCAGKDVLVDRETVREYHKKIPLISNYRFGVATENYQGTKGYISEKLIDVIRAGSVPIYLGDESVGEVIPSSSFVDVRKFRSHRALLRYLVNCPESEWQEMRTEGQSFLASKKAAVFGVSAFAETAMEILRKL